jgi:hypothetical protein
MSLSVSHDFKIQKMTLRKKNLTKKHKFCENHEKSRNRQTIKKNFLSSWTGTHSPCFYIFGIKFAYEFAEVYII